ncbi:MAG: LamG-like jellyroll fold domain-containing protein, partial [Saprospiraceae bacterium]
MVAYYSFDNCDAVDESGNGSDGQILGSPNCVCGVSGNALELDGVNDHVIFLGIVNNYFDEGNFAISFYFKSFGSPFPQDILSKREDCTPNNSFNVNFIPNQNAINNVLGESPSKIAEAQGILDFDNCWHHVVITRRGGFTFLYLDGILTDEEQVISRIDMTNNGVLSLADSPCLGLNANRFKGYFDELTVYSRHLLEEDVEQLYIKPDQIANADTLIYLGGEVETYTTNTCATNFEWFPKTGVTDTLSANTTLSPTETTTYQLNFTDANGCTATDEIVVTVIDPSQLDCSQIFVPKAFTPNGVGPGVNETIGISNP